MAGSNSCGHKVRHDWATNTFTFRREKVEKWMKYARERLRGKNFQVKNKCQGDEMYNTDNVTVNYECGWYDVSM